jgi:hypothetical protein
MPESSVVSGGGLERLDACQDGQFTPLPMAIDVGEPHLPEPGQLDLKIEEFIRGIFGFPARGTQELLVQGDTWRCHVFEV